MYCVAISSSLQRIRRSRRNIHTLLQQHSSSTELLDRPSNILLLLHPTSSAVRRPAEEALAGIAWEVLDYIRIEAVEVHSLAVAEGSRLRHRLVGDVGGIAVLVDNSLGST